MSFLSKILAATLVSLLLTGGASRAAVSEYQLIVAQQEINLTGRPVTAMTINGTIPGPVLRFREGDLARILVRNEMAVDTSIHWHGILVPPGMDGVPLLSFPPIAPGESFTYEFPIRQNGTYWYHSHSELQDQSGVYGAIVIEPATPMAPVDREYVVLLSDWSDEDPHHLLRNLKRGSEWFALEKGSAQSIVGAARLGLLGDYFRRELQRMPPMDIADLAYDRFLANGQPELRLAADPGEIIRLRVIDGSATTYFHLEFAGGPLRVIAADGIEVEPLAEQRLLIGVAETYDLLLTIPESGAFEFRATAHDGSGYASVWLGEGDPRPAPAVPRPNLYHAMGELTLANLLALTPAGAMGMGDAAVAAGRFDRPGLNGMAGMSDMNGMSGMNGMAALVEAPGAAPATPHPEQPEGHNMAEMGHGGEHGGGHGHGADSPPPMSEMHHDRMADHEMDTAGPEAGPAVPEAAPGRSGRSFASDFRPLAADVSSAGSLAKDGMDGGDGQRPWPPYDRLRALHATAFAPERPVREIRLTLDGDMKRYVWSLNNRILAESEVIAIRQGEIVRFIMINRTMMHHPMHLHGHFFRILNGQGDHAPLKHTVDVAPMSTTVIEFDANVAGDWFFHCHLLYHMESGMARLVHYDGFTPPPEVSAIRPRLYHDPWYFWGEAAVLSNMSEALLKTANTRNTLTAAWESGWEGVGRHEWEGLVTWDKAFQPFLSAFIGLDLLGAGNETDDSRGVLGLAWLLPLSIESRYWLDSEGGGRFAFEKGFTLTPRLSVSGEAEYDTHLSKWDGKAAVTYTISERGAVVGQWHSDFGWGVGSRFRF